METEVNFSVLDINVYFVLSSKYEKYEDCGEEMWDAFNKSHEYDVTPEWITEKNAMKMSPGKKDVFVMESFEGEIFEKLQMFKCTIVGPRCLLSCFYTGDPIPEGNTPVLNTAMRKFIVSASGFSSQIKADIQKKVEYMGGIYTKQLRSSVTHLVTDNVFSAKYERAAEMNINVVTYKWVEAVWETNLKDFVLADDSVFFKYKCPVFFNLIVTSTNLPKKVKDEVKRLINENGGEFMGVLDGEKVKVVIANENSGVTDKLKYAMQNNIACLRPNWIYESIEKGYSLPFENFVIKSTKACSTPEKSSAHETLNFSSISVIAADSKPIVIDETMSTTSVMSSTHSSVSAQSNGTPNSYVNIVDRLDVTEAKKAGPFLDGCNIYLIGFRSNHRDKLNRILSIGSATRFDDISEDLSHVIIGDASKANNELRIIKSKNIHPYILKLEWLEESLKIKMPAQEDRFFFQAQDSEQQSTEPPSPLSQKNLQMLQRPKIPPPPLFDKPLEKKKSTSSDDKDSDIIQQYLQKNDSDADLSLRNLLKIPNNTNKENYFDETEINNRKAESINKNNEYEATIQDNKDDSAIPISQDTQKIFQGLSFIVKGFDNDEEQQLFLQILGLGGKLCHGKQSFADYGIIPLKSIDFKTPVKQIVTNLFIEDCIDQEKLVDIAYYHKSITVPEDTSPLSDCVMGMSSYTGVERTFLSKLSEYLGAKYQDTFARKTNLEKKTYSSTHLICPLPEGNKYNAAVKWKLPAVTAEWLLKCYEEMELVDETPYLVGETIAPDRPEPIKSKSEAKKPPLTVSPKRLSFLDQNQFLGGVETPVNRKRVNFQSGKTPQSPFHVTTPDTPYGQIFKDNPSPKTRKAWLKFTNNIPDLREKEPPCKKRRSTPFSDVKREVWDIITGRKDAEEGCESNAQNKDDEKNLNAEETSENQLSINRKLSFSDNGSPKTPSSKNINLQIAQLNDLFEKANTPESRGSNGDKQYHIIETMPEGRRLVKESQPESVGWEDPIKRVPPQRKSIIQEESIKETEDFDETCQDVTRDMDATSGRIRKRKFMFSGIKDKSIAEKIIKDLGGECSNENSFDMSATHLLITRFARNEKILSSVASGKWIIHYLYIEACNDEKKFIDEEEFEFGNPKSKGIIPDPTSENERIIMKAAHKWRLKLLKEPGGAFKNMVAILMTQKEKRDQFARLIQAGGGKIVVPNSSYDSSPPGHKITHCFVQPKQIEQQVEWAKMANKGIMCFSPQFLNDFLMSDTPLNLKECVLPEFTKYLSLMKS